MRRGRVAGAQETGGAWQCAAMLRPERSKPLDSEDAGITANAMWEENVPCTDEDCTKGACIVGMVLQQS